nr:MAG TPA: hypothetical protein [Caudoviricetes sp.]
MVNPSNYSRLNAVFLYQISGKKNPDLSRVACSSRESSYVRI